MREAPDPYATDPDRFEWYRRFTLTPVDPEQLRDAVREGQTLETTDIPGYLGRPARASCDPGDALYRLVQLWGTPNVPGVTAGAIQRDRDLTTWQYLFEVEYEPRPEDDAAIPRSFDLSVYDYRTEVSAGLSAFTEAEPDRGPVREPAPSVVASMEMPPTWFLEGVVALTLNMVEEPVPATYGELWV